MKIMNWLMIQCHLKIKDLQHKMMEEDENANLYKLEERQRCQAKPGHASEMPLALQYAFKTM